MVTDHTEFRRPGKQSQDCSIVNEISEGRY